jgi:hypothetical protein
MRRKTLEVSLKSLNITVNVGKSVPGEILTMKNTKVQSISGHGRLNYLEFRAKYHVNQQTYQELKG